MLNKVQLIGRLGADPESHSTRSGSAVAVLRLATSSRRKEGEEWVDHTEWHHVVCFGRTAEAVAAYLKKGRLVYVEGQLRTETWEDKEGHERRTTKVLASTVQFIPRQRGGTPQGRGSGDRQDDASHPTQEEAPF